MKALGQPGAHPYMTTVIIQGSNGAQGALQVDSEGYLLVSLVGGSGGPPGGSGGGSGGTRTVTVQVPVPDPATVEENKRLKAKVAELEERIKKL
jgi:hypothetical protein